MTTDYRLTHSKAPIIRTGHWAVWVVHTMAYVPLRIIGTLEYSAVFCNNTSVGIRFSQPSIYLFL